MLSGCESGELDRAEYEEYLTTAQPRLCDLLRVAHPDQRAALQAIKDRLVSLPLRLAQTALARARAEVLERPVHPSRLVAEPASASAHDVPASGTIVARAQIASRSGTIRVSLPRNGARHRRGVVLYQGHPVCHTEATYPLEALIDVTRDDLLDGYASLSATGKQWAQETTVLASLKLLDDCAQRKGFASDVDLLHLCEALLQAQVQLTARIATVLRIARWPTVQGSQTTLGMTPTLPVATAPQCRGSRASSRRGEHG